MGIGSWLYTNSTKNLRVKIVHPGGHAELHERPILASEIIRRNPKCCVAHPNVFKQPWSIVQPDTLLLPGQKVYVVPISTVRKLQKLSIKKSLLSGQEDQSFKENSGEDDVGSDTSCCSVDDVDGICMTPFNESQSNTKSCFTCMGSKRKREGTKESGTSSNAGDQRNMKNGGSPGKLISSLDYWQPSLHRIVEERSVSTVVEERSNIQE